MWKLFGVKLLLDFAHGYKASKANFHGNKKLFIGRHLWKSSVSINISFLLCTHYLCEPFPYDRVANPCIDAIFAWSGTTVSPRHNTFKEESSVRLADHGTSWIPLAGVLTAFLKTSADHWVVDGRAIGLFTTALWHNWDSHLHEDVWWRTAWGKSSESWKNITRLRVERKC